MLESMQKSIEKNAFKRSFKRAFKDIIQTSIEKSIVIFWWFSLPTVEPHFSINCMYLMHLCTKVTICDWSAMGPEP
jgi:hypothetical protein